MVCSYACFISRFSPLHPTPLGFRVPISMATLDKVSGWCYHSMLPHRRSQPYGLFMNLHDSTRPTEILLVQVFLSLKARIQSRASSLRSTPMSREWRKSTTKVVTHPSPELPCHCLQISLTPTYAINHILYMPISETGNSQLPTRIVTFQLYHD